MIEIEKTGALWIVTLNRPDKANALTGEMLEQLCVAIESSTDEAKALILTGRGKVFSAGADLDEAAKGLAVSPLWERLSGAIANHPGLTICALNGTLAGGACGMALACDLRLAVPGAKVFYPVMKLGYLPQPSDPARLKALVGPARAKMILMGGLRVLAPEALTWGLIDRIADEDLIEQAKALTEAVLAASPAHVLAIKEMIA